MDGGIFWIFVGYLILMMIDEGEVGLIRGILIFKITYVFLWLIISFTILVNYWYDLIVFTKQILWSYENRGRFGKSKFAASITVAVV